MTSISDNGIVIGSRRLTINHISCSGLCQHGLYAYCMSFGLLLFFLAFFVTLLIHDGGRDLASWTSESIIKLLWKKKKKEKEKVKTKASQQENYFKSYIDQFSSWCVYRKTKRAEIFELDELHEYFAFRRNKNGCKRVPISKLSTSF